jgi:hypothetical protein
MFLDVANVRVQQTVTLNVNAASNMWGNIAVAIFFFPSNG